MKKISALLLILLPLIAFSQNDFKAIDSILSIYDQGFRPGVSMRIVKDGIVIYNKHSGYANLEINDKLTDNSIFYLASVSKQFTGACIVLLKQQGKLNFTDKLSDYFPDMPVYAQDIIIYDLLNHTSGIKDIVALAGLKKEKVEDYDNEKIYRLLSVQELDFKPGSEHSYNNSGYWFLAQIIEKVSGMSLNDFAVKNIFTPLGMKNTRYVYKGDDYFENRVFGYWEKEDKYFKTEVDAVAVIGGGLYSTLGDLQKWLEEMQSNKVLGKVFWNKMLKGKMYEESDYAYNKGLYILNDEKGKQITHGGVNDGFNTYVSLFPDEKLSVITLSNNDDAPVEYLHSLGADIALGIKEESHKEEILESKRLPDSLLMRYDGLYNQNGYFYKVSHEHGVLSIMQVFNDLEFDLVPIHDSSFSKDNYTFTFEDIQNGKAQKMIILSSNVSDIAVRREVAVNDFERVTGSFYCSNLDVTYFFYKENGVLKCKVGNDETEGYFAVYKAFFDFGVVKYDFDENKRVKGFTLNHPRFRNIRFVKVESTE
ncbi:beta-lactamase family protein [Flavobacterium alkalisoli]|uniref:Beta-lactamase family protein n=1 Tax=Flavobacterium alkalisoli TaxID=2602769 RepID=A0A5B9FQB1_9FLAO|nr:serine hydrolase domain-containing protein [Flavobacterium alkalisoli]QEE49483.1 beta-lactamase family protein [Flavobacterium alkalisoli]